MATALVVAAALAGAAWAVATLVAPGSDQAGTADSTPSEPPDPASAQARVRPASGEATSGSTRIGYTITPAPSGDGAAQLRLTLTDAVSGAAVDIPAPPVVWADLQRTSGASGAPAEQTCEDKAGLFAQGRLGVQPDVDLNSYYILTLNEDSTISVIDPHADVAGMTQLRAMPTLRAPGEDWAFDADARRLFVTMPDADRVAVVDTATFEVVTEIDAGDHPTSIAAAGDTLWVTNDAGQGRSGGVTVIDAATLSRTDTLPTGTGPGRVRFLGDAVTPASDPHAAHGGGGGHAESVVVPHRDGTVTVVDAATLQPVHEHRLDAPVTDVATVPGAPRLYAALAGDHPVTVLDAETFAVVGRLDGVRDVSTLALAPDGHLLFALGAGSGTVTVIDAHSGGVLARGDVGMPADQVSFTNGYAFVRSAQQPRIGVIDLARPGGPGALDVVTVPIGQGVPAEGAADAAADALAPVHGAEMLVANAADQYVYLYMPGMNAAMGGFQNYGRAPRAVTVHDRGLAREAPGVWTAALTAPAPGTYDLLVALDEPPVLQCFAFSADPAGAAAAEPVPVAVEALEPSTTLPAGKPGTLAFRLLDAAGQPVTGLTDVRAFATSVAGRDDTRAAVTPRPDGSYAAELTLPKAGRYAVWVTVPSLDVSLGDVDALEIEATT